MDKRKQVIEVATELFSERGFENTPLSAVCEKANVSKGLIFHHFKSKDDLLREIFSTTTDLIIEINQSKQLDQTPQERIIELLESFFTQLEADKMFFQLSLNAMLQPKTRAILGDLIKQRSSFILKSVRSIFDNIDPENSRLTSYLFIAELDGIALNYLGVYDDFPLEEVKVNLINRYKQQ